MAVTAVLDHPRRQPAVCCAASSGTGPSSSATTSESQRSSNDPTSRTRGSLDHPLWFALNGREILAYTTDGRDMCRFVGALRARLLQLTEESPSPAATTARATVPESTAAP